MNRKVFLYVKAFSDLGTFMDLIAINVLMYIATGSPAWLAATMAFRTLGGVLSSLFSGVLADRFDRRKIMIWTDVFRAIIILSLIPFPNPVMILVVCFLIGLTSSFFAVSYSAEIPQIFGQDKVLETNALISRLTSISLVFGFIGAGLITDFLGYQVTLIIDAATYLISAAVLIKIKWQTTEPANSVLITNGFKQKVSQIGRDLKEVYTFILSVPMLLYVNIVFLVGSFAGASHNLGIPLLAETIDSSKQSLIYGLIWGVWGIGSVLATVLLPKMKFLQGNHLYRTYFFAAILMSTGFITFLSNLNIWIVLMFAFFTGIFDACFTTLHATILQKTENYIRGRIFGVGMLLKSLGFALGFVVAPILLEALSLAKMVWIFHGTLITSSFLVMLYSNANRKKYKEVNQSL
ncbi:MFS transporter [Mesobacillus selenatarsenatis]|uniref:COG0477 permeases of the major facilitator superfamily n=1 Tax=Mesobacillus selenatarsenatis (strain DSM 18680 / JCM 14380 / FERM P-15431 / SF-1) TaxID=1321606 RepID=A0A0A8X090_MESS1|nr:MFS transporter [Mesobacillus selenatarsenatis]GAM13385.1 COG0477 permeases of the major facilitator superfamily [Mesobacillus selenatarsenatis SF-1]